MRTPGAQLPNQASCLGPGTTQLCTVCFPRPEPVTEVTQVTQITAGRDTSQPERARPACHQPSLSLQAASWALVRSHAETGSSMDRGTAPRVSAAPPAPRSGDRAMPALHVTFLVLSAASTLACGRPMAQHLGRAGGCLVPPLGHSTGAPAPSRSLPVSDSQPCWAPSALPQRPAPRVCCAPVHPPGVTRHPPPPRPCSRKHLWGLSRGSPQPGL